AALAAESLAICRRLGRRYGMVPPIGNIGVAALLRHRHEEAVDLFREGITLAHEHQYTEGLICCLVGLAAVRAATGEPGDAATLCGIMAAVVGTSGFALEPLERGLYDSTEARVSSALGEDAFAVAFATGKQLTREEGVAYALGVTT